MNRERWNRSTGFCVALAVALGYAYTAPAADAGSRKDPRKTARPRAEAARAKPAAPARAQAHKAQKAKGFHAPDAYFVLQKEHGIALAARDLEKAEEASRAQMLLRPDRALPYYNLATVFALRGQAEAAVESLTRAMDRGFGFPDLLRSDPDLARLRPHPLWESLLARAETVRQARLAENVTLQGSAAPATAAVATTTP